MDQEKEIPPMTLRDRDGPGMHLYFGYISGKFRCRVYVPTTVYDSLVASICIYQFERGNQQLPDRSELVVARDYVPLKSMPKWRVEYQALELSTRDKRRVFQKLDRLERKLSGLEKKLEEEE